MSGKVARRYEMDMCNGPLFKKMLIFTLPLFITVYLTHCSFAVNEYNEHIKKINQEKNDVPTKMLKMK